MTHAITIHLILQRYALGPDSQTRSYGKIYLKICLKTHLKITSYFAIYLFTTGCVMNCLKHLIGILGYVVSVVEL